MAAEEIKIHVEHLKKNFGKIEVLKDISIDDAYINNTPSLHNFPKPAERDSFFAAYQKESIAGIRKKYPAEKKMISLLRKVKHILKK